MHVGQTRNFGNSYLDRFAREAAYREDTRRRSNGIIFNDITSAALDRCRHAISAATGRGNKKLGENFIGELC